MRLGAYQRLVKARELIAAGWTQKCFARDKNGFNTPYSGPAAVSFCMAGVLRHLQTGLPDDAMLYGQTVEALYSLIGVGLAPWNDQPERTQQQVLSVFDAAIAIAREEGLDW